MNPGVPPPIKGRGEGQENPLGPLGANWQAPSGRAGVRQSLPVQEEPYRQLLRRYLIEDESLGLPRTFRVEQHLLRCS